MEQLGHRPEEAPENPAPPQGGSGTAPAGTGDGQLPVEVLAHRALIEALQARVKETHRQIERARFAKNQPDMTWLFLENQCALMTALSAVIDEQLVAAGYPRHCQWQMKAVGGNGAGARS